jgi:hypothetical protein
MEPGTPASLKKQKRTLEAQQEEVPKSPGLDSVQSFNLPLLSIVSLSR